MADVIPLKVKRTLGDTDALGEFESGDKVPQANSPTLNELGGTPIVTFAAHLGDSGNPHSVTASQVGAVPTSQVGVNNGIAELDGTGKVPVSQIPASALPEFKVIADATSRLALTVQEGDEAKQLDDGSHWIYDGTTWHQFPTAPVIIFGTQYHYSSSTGISTTTSTTFQNKVTLVTSNLPLGDYMVNWSYGWNHNAVNSDFEARFLRNNVSENEIHKQEPKDSAGGFGASGTSQRMYVYRKDLLEQITGVQTFDLQYRTDDSDDESSIWEARIELWRIS